MKKEPKQMGLEGVDRPNGKTASGATEPPNQAITSEPDAPESGIMPIEEPSGSDAKPDVTATVQVAGNKSQGRSEGRLDQPQMQAASGGENTKSESRLQSRTTISQRHERQEFFLPVTGFVWLYPEEVDVVDHPSVQRLGKIYQLGQTYLVYRGATHKRLEHVLGAVHVVQRMMEAVEHNRLKTDGRNEPPPDRLSEFEQRFIRLGALLHDIGHLAAGHTVEDELELIGKHDEDQRLTMIFESTAWSDLRGQTLGVLVDSDYASYVPKEVANLGVTPSEIVRLLIRKKPEGPVASNDRMDSVEKTVKDSGLMRIDVCRDMIGNTICADLLDYLHRDWYHVGKPRPFDERILQYMEVRQDDASTSVPPSRKDQYFVISLGRRPKLRTDAISNILDLLEWRYQLAESVLFHRTKLAATAMLDRALYELWGADSSAVEEILFPLSDEQMLSRCRELAERQNSPVAASLIGRLEKRQLFVEFDTLFYGDRPNIDIARIKQLYAGVPTSGKPTRDLVRKAAANRQRAAALLEKDFNLPVGSVAMYCPAKVNAKIAEVRIGIEDKIYKFNEYESANDNHLSGGHLDAQLKRFARLWRVHLFIDPAVKGNLGELSPLLRDAVRRLVFNDRDESDETSEQAVKNLAKLLALTEGCFWKGKAVADTSVYGAYKDATAAVGEYPTGRPSIRAFFTEKPQD